MNIALSETKEYFEKLKKNIKCGTKNVKMLVLLYDLDSNIK